VVLCHKGELLEIIPTFTKKTLNFISDIELRKILEHRLNELDKITMVGASYSILFLSMSTLEGILKHLVKLFRSRIKTLGKPKNSDKSTINKLYTQLTDLSIIPKIKDFEQISDFGGKYRDFIHPHAQLTEKTVVDLGEAQLALGLLNVTVGLLANSIFIDNYTFRTVEGNPDYYSEILRLELHQSPLHSCLVYDKPVSQTASLSFDLQLPPGAVFNFIFNFRGIGDFKMIRLDTREPRRGEVNSILYCTQRYFWDQVLLAVDPHPPKKTPIPVTIKIDFGKKLFEFIVDGTPYKFKDRKGTDRNLIDEIEAGLKIGFFNEVRPVNLSNIRLNL
jgi:hypothetical protein